MIVRGVLLWGAIGRKILFSVMEALSGLSGCYEELVCQADSASCDVSHVKFNNLLFSYYTRVLSVWLHYCNEM